MLELAQHHVATLLSALLIGVATGWWMFRHRRQVGSRPARRLEIEREQES